MPSQSFAPPESLPRSHYFVTLSRGSGMRTVAVRAHLLHLALVILTLLIVGGLGSGLYLAFHDDLVAELMRRQSDQQYAYEDRIDGLRQDLERQTERSRSERSALDLRVHDLFAREARLESRAAALSDLGPQRGVRRTDPSSDVTGHIAPTPSPSGIVSRDDKPHPLIEPPARGPSVPRSAERPEDHASLLDDPRFPIGDRLGAASLALDIVESRQTAELAQVGAVARERTGRLRAVIEDAGLSPERYLPRGPATSLGGPFVPLPAGSDGAFDRAIAGSRSDIAAASALGSALGHIPLAAPLSGRMDVTSPFGARTDPFLGRPALHTGVDLREGYGTDVRTTAAGRVSFAGTAGGYGSMVEVDHGDGIVTRYAHMGSIAVAEGQALSRGAPVGTVGATGRATGPHLHYEVRIDGEPVDPTRFLALADRVTLLDRP